MDETTARILDAACEEIALVGIKRTSMEDVARRAGVSRVTVYRHAGDWSWLVERCLGIAALLEAAVPTWPKNDNHALCSPKWCPAWSTCKGAHYAPSWPKPSMPLTDRVPSAN